MDDVPADIFQPGLLNRAIASGALDQQARERKLKTRFTPRKVVVGILLRDKIYSEIEQTPPQPPPKPQTVVRGGPRSQVSRAGRPFNDLAPQSGPLLSMPQPPPPLDESSFLGFNLSKGRFFFKLFLPNYKHVPAMYPLRGEIPFDDVSTRGVRLDRSTQDGQAAAILTVTAVRPPRYKVSSELDPRRARTRACTEMDFGGPGRSEGQAGPVSVSVKIGPSSVYFDAGLCKTFQFQFDISDFEALQALVILLADITPEENEHEISMVSARPSGFAAVARKLQLPSPGSVNPFANESFAVRYLIDGLLSRNLILARGLVALHKVLFKYGETAQIREDILDALCAEDRLTGLENKIRELSAVVRRYRRPPASHIVAIRKCFVTPCRVMPVPPQIETSNRVLQKYHDKLDRFLRVQFTLEDDLLFVNAEEASFDDDYPDRGMLGRIRRTLRNGLYVGGRKFTFLANSESQAKEKSCWLFAESSDLTCDDIRAWMGDFSKEKIIAKQCARYSLCLSTSRRVIDFVHQRTIPDIERNGHCFTDGVGYAHDHDLETAAAALGGTGCDAFPSAIQVRSGGVKGLIVRSSPLLPPALQPKRGELLVRPSQKKFDSPHDQSLQAMKLSKYSVAFLNRQFVMLLAHAGVSEKILDTMFTTAIADVKRLSTYPKAPDGYIDEGVFMDAHISLPALKRAGFVDEPIMQAIIGMIESHRLQEIRFRARIPVKQGTFLFGVADDLGILREGEVFCQTEDSQHLEHGAKVRLGPAVVMRAPALHPGDVQRVTLVDLPQLRHLTNVIVFSTRGTRSLPSMLSGGDLDGDQFTLIWDSRLLPTETFEPYSYEAPPALTTDQHVGVLEITNFFLDFIKADNLGQIANLWLCRADFDDPSDTTCLELVELHSRAVDYQKTGIAAIYPHELNIDKRPDFMGREESQSYKSDKILGRIFRKVPPFNQSPPSSLPVVDDRRLSDVDVPRDWLVEATRLKRRYDHGMHSIMRRYNITEIEIVAGLVLSWEKKRRPKADAVREAVRDAYQEHQRLIVLDARDWVEGQGLPPFLAHAADPITVFAVAAYQVQLADRKIRSIDEDLGASDGLGGMTWSEAVEVEEAAAYLHEGEDDEVAIDLQKLNSRIPLLSFPWVFASQLCAFVADNALA